MASDTEDVCVVLVTYNRVDLLVQTLDAVRRQTVPPSRVLVVDNASTDGTPEMCRRLFTEDGYSAFRHVRLEDNTGGAGGFSRGMRLAHGAGHDWLWLMDDDVAPDINCLEQLLRWRRISSCIHPRAIEVDGSSFPWAKIAVAGTAYIFDHAPSVHSDLEWQFSNMACFEGMMIHRSVVDRVGYPDERFFIAWDDMVYGMKVSRTTNIVSIRDAKIRRLLSRKPWKGRSLYYAARNFFLAKQLLREIAGPEAGSPLFNWLAFIRIVRPHLRSPSEFRVILMAAVDGIKGRWGRTSRTFRA